MKKNSIKKKKIYKDTWALDYAFLKWLDERLTAYLKYAGKIIDLTEYKYIFNKQEYTQEEMIKMLIEKVKYMIYLMDEGTAENNEVYINTMHDIMDIWKLIIFQMGW